MKAKKLYKGKMQKDGLTFEVNDKFNEYILTFEMEEINSPDINVDETDENISYISTPYPGTIK